MENTVEPVGQDGNALKDRPVSDITAVTVGHPIEEKGEDLLEKPELRSFPQMEQFPEQDQAVSLRKFPYPVHHVRYSSSTSPRRTISRAWTWPT